MHHVKLSDPADRTVDRILRAQAEMVGDDEFLVEENTRHTYAAVDDLADRHASGYAELGIGAGDTVALLMHNSVDMAVTSFGVNRLGAVWSAISPEYRGEWLGELLNSVGSPVLVLDDELWSSVAALPVIPFRHLVIRGSSQQARSEAPAGVAVHDFDDLARGHAIRHDSKAYYGDTNAILWTSGTTGRSKGVMQSHNVWITYAQRHNEIYRDGVREGERFYGCIPMYNSGGWIMNVYPALLTGVPACIDKRFSVSDYWNRLRYFDAHHTILLGTMPLYLAQQPACDDDTENPLRTACINPLPRNLPEFMARFGLERVGSGFGQSEIMGATLYSSDWPLKPGSSGFVRDDDPVETRLLDADDNEVGENEVGEICVRPRAPFAIFNGYFNEPEKTIEAFRNLWYHTGDLARRDADGELFFADRKKDSLRHKGRNINSFEVEHIARQFPGVTDVAAVGVTLTEMDHEEELRICLLLGDGATVDRLEFCKFMDAKAPYYFVPRYVDVLDAFPLTPTGKVQKFKIRERGIDAATWDRLEHAADWSPTR
ncbi:AMP-binding protein [Mycolicibacterium hodleri]|nr:AMP-binding protein [Mycolicibacterium hodleri]